MVISAASRVSNLAANASGKSTRHCPAGILVKSLAARSLLQKIVRCLVRNYWLVVIGVGELVAQIRVHKSAKRGFGLPIGPADMLWR